MRLKFEKEELIIALEKVVTDHREKRLDAEVDLKEYKVEQVALREALAMRIAERMVAGKFKGEIEVQSRGYGEVFYELRLGVSKAEYEKANVTQPNQYSKSTEDSINASIKRLKMATDKHVFVTEKETFYQYL